MKTKYDSALYTKTYREKKKKLKTFDFNKAWDCLMDSEKLFVCSEHAVTTEVNKVIDKSKL